MTSEEWIKIGLQNGIIDSVGQIENVTFADAFLMWFKMKMNIIKPQSLDRIEVTFRRYYQSADIAKEYIAKIDTSYISDFLNTIILSIGTITDKEYRRIYQIINNVMIYCLDLNIGGARLINWGLIKRLIPLKCIQNENKKEYCIPFEDIEIMTHSVVNLNIYPLKKSASLCLLLNFYLGLRIGELASLKWSDIDYERGIIKVCNTEIKYYERDADGKRVGTMKYEIVEDLKTKYSFREIPLIPKALYFIELIRKHHTDKGYQSDYLAYDGVDSILVCSLDKTLRKLCKLSNIKYFNSHLLRKSYATYLHNAGVPTRVISDLLGHSEISTTERVYIVSTLPDLDILKGKMQKAFERR